VQIAPYAYSDAHINGALLREAQTEASAHPKTGMVVISDLVDNIKDIHPTMKKEVAARLAAYALADTYGMNVGAYKSPIYKTHTIEQTSKKFEVSISTVKKYSNKKFINRTEDDRKKANYNHVKTFRKRTKEKAVEYKGGKCNICNYDRCISALEFHHLEPSKKDFTLSQSMNIAWNKIEEELDKCILVCANCHREIHEGIIKIVS
jgi:hypothetical protein